MGSAPHILADIGDLADLAVLAIVTLGAVIGGLINAVKKKSQQTGPKGADKSPSLRDLLNEALIEAELIEPEQKPARPPPPPRPPQEPARAQAPPPTAGRPERGRSSERQDDERKARRLERAGRQGVREARRAKERAARFTYRGEDGVPPIAISEGVAAPLEPAQPRQERSGLRKLIRSHEGLRLGIIMRVALGKPVGLSKPRQ